MRPAGRPPDPEYGYEVRRMYQEHMRAPQELTSAPGGQTGELARMTFLRGRLPRCYAWIRTTAGVARRVTILFDSGASHCFIHPKVIKDLGLTSTKGDGPAKLRLADDHVVPCHGTVPDLQVLAGSYKQRMAFVAADVGSDDIILGGEVLEAARAGFGDPGFWNMTVDGKVVSIPLIGEHSRNAEVTRVQGVKTSVKLISAHFGHILMGRIWKSENVESQDS